MYSSYQKRLAIKYLLLSPRDKDEISKLLSEENMSVLNRIIGDLREAGIDSKNLVFIQDRIQLNNTEEDTFAEGDSQLFREVKKFVIDRHQPAPEKLFEFLELASRS